MKVLIHSKENLPAEQREYVTNAIAGDFIVNFGLIDIEYMAESLEELKAMTEYNLSKGVARESA